MVLHIAVLEHLLLHFLLGRCEFLSFIIQFSLNLIDIAVKSRDRLFQIVDFLIFLEQLTLVRLNVIL